MCVYICQNFCFDVNSTDDSDTSNVARSLERGYQKLSDILLAEFISAITYFLDLQYSIGESRSDKNFGKELVLHYNICYKAA